MNFNILSIYLSIFCFLFSSSILSQVKKDNLFLGGISTKPENQLILEKAIMGVQYQFCQQAMENKKIITLCDTLLLAAGNTHSLFLDAQYKTELEKARKERIRRSVKAGKANTTYQDVNDIVELINATSDYKEESLGNPVQIYKNRTKKTVTSVFNTFVENVSTEQRINEFSEWQITNETDTILNYLCKKATVTYAGREYIAWFTLDIPLSDGPWKFHGLPGLIVKVEDSEGLFRFIAIGLEQYKDNEIYIVADKVDYDKSTLKNFNLFAEREKSRFRVSFYNGGELYMTFKKNPITFFSMEADN